VEFIEWSICSSSNRTKHLWVFMCKSLIGVYKIGEPHVYQQLVCYPKVSFVFTSPNSPMSVIAGTCDGSIQIWDLRESSGKDYKWPCCMTDSWAEKHSQEIVSIFQQSTPSKSSSFQVTSVCQEGKHQSWVLFKNLNKLGNHATPSRRNVDTRIIANFSNENNPIDLASVFPFYTVLYSGQKSFVSSSEHGPINHHSLFNDDAFQRHLFANRRHLQLHSLLVLGILILFWQVMKMELSHTLPLISKLHSKLGQSVPLQ